MKIMQQIDGEFQNTPSDVQLLRVRSSVSTQLNKDDGNHLSAVGEVLPSINPDGVQPEYTQGPTANYVYIFNNLFNDKISLDNLTLGVGY